ncbi:hypothetical protein BGZ60DRAFT_472846 [Tricladium varicosporioides]|nr:hypothetical protein BGZ60DRAFT_472846 [Hymenoscyphus varicosporioides]
MGRKPNPLILRYFDRGAKLNDSSNRYAHTCKQCGDHFPKGRIDSLNNHISKKCPGLNEAERRSILLEMNNMPNDGIHSMHNGEMQMGVPQPPGVIGNNGEWTALEALAEVSRQMQNPDHSESNQVKRGVPGDTPPAKRLKLQEQYTLDNPPLSYEQRVLRDKKLIDQKNKGVKGEQSFTASSNSIGNGETSMSNNPFLHTTELPQHLRTMTAYQPNSNSLRPGNYPPDMTHSRSASPNLVMAEHSIAQAQAARFVPPMVNVDPHLDPQLQLLANNDNNPSHITEDSLSQEDFYGAVPDDQHQTWMTDPQNDNSYAEQDNTQYSHPPATMQATPAPSSMQQVLPPSNYPPLAMNPVTSMTTEFNQESGDGQRVNRPKTRARFQEDRRKEVQAVRQAGACSRCRMLKKPCGPDNENGKCATCAKVENPRIWKNTCSRDRLEAVLKVFGAGAHAVLAYNNINNIKKVMEFVASDRVIDVSHYPETNIFSTVKVLEGHQRLEPQIDPGLDGNLNAQPRLILDHENDDLPLRMEQYVQHMLPLFIEREPSLFIQTTLTIANQTCQQHSNDVQNGVELYVLLSDALKFWSFVHVLIDNELEWTIVEKSDSSQLDGTGIEIAKHGSTWDTITYQLSAAVEKRADLLGKSIVGKIERMLLTNKYAGSFEVFLASILVLNCLEKSTWLFTCWAGHQFREKWPLDPNDPPEQYCEQGDRVTGILNMLLRMRHVPPKAVANNEGILTFAGDEQSKVTARRDHPEFSQINSRCFELRYCSHLLLQDPTGSPR